MSMLRQPSKASDDLVVEPARDEDNPARDEADRPGTSGDDSGTGGTSWTVYAIVAAAVFAFTLVNAFSAAYDAVRRGGAYELGRPLFWELTSAVVIIALAPLIAFCVRKARLERAWHAQALWAIATVLLFSALHIAGMVGLRKLLLGFFGDSYHFGFSLAELTYEFRKDVVTCFMIGSAFWLYASRRDKKQAVAAEALPVSAPPNVLWLRDGPARIRIEPQDIVMVTSAGNYVEYCMAGGRTHLIRGTLAAEEARLALFGVVRVHRTRLVNLSRVNGLQSGPNGDFELTLDTGQTVSGSRRYRGAVASVDPPRP